jgi:hypothetical protein
MPSCCVIGCKSISSEVQQFPFPKDSCQLKNRWLRQMKRDNWKPGLSAYVCSNHFTKDSFLSAVENKDKRGRRRKRLVLHENAVPTIFNYSIDIPMLTSSRKPPTAREPISRTCYGPPPVCAFPSAVVEADHPYSSLPKKDRTEVSQPVRANERWICHDHAYAATRPVPISRPLEAEDFFTPSIFDPPPAEVDQVSLLKKRIDQLEQELDHLKREKNGVRKVFDQDQIDLLSGLKNRVRWSDDAIQKATHVRYVCGSTGYELLRTMGYPLPSCSVIVRKLRAVSFQPGILDDVFTLMKLKLAKMRPEERECVLTFDEMSIQARMEYDVSTQTILGLANLPTSSSKNAKKKSGN